MRKALRAALQGVICLAMGLYVLEVLRSVGLILWLALHEAPASGSAISLTTGFTLFGVVAALPLLLLWDLLRAVRRWK
jgi:hypothetical protein